MSPVLVRSLIAEFLGTALLVFLAVGSAVAGLDALGPTGVAFAFGLTLLALAYAFGPISGCHINPAVTLGVLLSGGIAARDAVGYWIVQFAGGIAGAAVLKLLTSDFGDVTDQTGALGSNNWGDGISLGGAFVLEVLLTFLFVLVILLVTGKAAAPGFAGLAIGLALTAVHLIGIQLDGTSVNPARSLGPALFDGGESLSHVWLFIVAPLIGGALAVAVSRVLATSALDEPEPTTPEGVAREDRTGAELPPELRPADGAPGARTAREP
ncbi:aquaporin [Blastococcus sp. URHD0036]|uniref:aquaporin n=1 Tax=Blastococcus sp. URHD0036 TaxID=1380356 RepID=UPI000AFEE05A|nr:aquaporin [Blastococcus sp. URHD0036]